MDDLDTILARADELMANAPGRVSVRRISHIEDVRLLRAARAALSADEQQQLRMLRLAVMERLDGALSTAPVAVDDEKPSLGELILGRLRQFSQKQQAQSAERRNDGEGLAVAAPAPVELIDAAEVWAIAHLVAERIEGDLSGLQRPWNEATIEPV